jgi:hypothetical protein
VGPYGGAGRVAAGVRPHLPGRVRRLRLVDIAPAVAEYDDEVKPARLPGRGGTIYGSVSSAVPAQRLASSVS